MNIQVLPTETHSLLLELLQTTFGSAVQMDGYCILNQHPDYCALLVRVRQPTMEFAVKLAGPDAPYHYPFDRTAMIHRLVATQTSIPMPEVIAVDVSYKTYPWRYLIKTYLPAEEWQTVKPQLNGQEQVDAYRQIGNTVAQLHRINFEGFGEVDSDGKVVAGTNYSSALAVHVQEIIKNEHHQDLMLNLLDAHSSLFEAVSQPRLCHEDLHHHNILFRQENRRWQLATILDFDKAWAGHHEIDLAKMEFWTDMMGDGFWDAYHRVIPGDHLYPQRRPIYQLLWCLEYANNSPRHLADTRRLCETLNLPLIEQFA
jgi:fructosamine-3-kinase